MCRFKKGVGFLGVVLFLCSCVKAGGPCEEAVGIYQAGIGITFKNAQGNYLYRELFPLYDVDSLKVFDQNGYPLKQYRQLNVIPDSNFLYNEIQVDGIYNDSTDKTAFDSEVCKKFIIQYYHNDRDTIQTCFKAKEHKCQPVFEYFNVYHKGRLLAATKQDFVQITIVKP